MADKAALIVFVRPPELGKVKTRLAKTMGDENALKVYIFLLDHTRKIVSASGIPVFVFYSEYLLENDAWRGNNFNKRIQSGGDLGFKMQNAFTHLFEQNYAKVIIIGSDCYDLSVEIILQGFKQLDQHDITLGPAVDGGYYLLGLKKLIPELFINKSWSSKDVYQETMHDIETLGLSVGLLPVLTDVDEEADVTFNYLKSEDEVDLN